MQNWIPVVAACVAACAAITAAVIASRTAFVLHKRTRTSDREDQTRKERAEARKEWAPFLAKVDALALAALAYSETGKKVLATRTLRTGTNLPVPLDKAMRDVVEAKALGELAGPPNLAKQAEYLIDCCIAMADAAISVALYQDGTLRCADEVPYEDAEDFELEQGKFNGRHHDLQAVRRLFVDEANRLLGLEPAFVAGA
ncbi:hypothetical protein AB0D11_46375 [Streptomyces monashensis]|uniref:hypothetical protein n=1 Tax=Streptomyces monashensis TaxID=1678012 RepID=UPI0033DEB442